MPTKPLAACLEPGCSGRATDAGRCADHARLRRERYLATHPDDRPSARERGYDETWRRLRRVYLLDHPWCAFCASVSIFTPATDVDHITPLDEGGARLDPRNLRALCHAHHSQRTAREHGLGARKGER